MLYDRGADANCYRNSSQSPLLWAFRTHNASLRNKLERGRGPGAWHYNAVRDMEAVVSLLLQYDADPNITHGKGRTILPMAVKYEFNSKEPVAQLLKAGSNPNMKDKYGRTPLMGAEVRKMEQVVAALLEAQSLDRDATDVFGRTALIEATKICNLRLVKFLS